MNSEKKQRKRLLKNYFNKRSQQWYFSFFYRLPSDKQVDEWLDDELAIIKKKAMKKLQLFDEDIEGKELSVIGFRKKNLLGLKLQYRKGKDELYRFNPIVVSIFFTAQHKLCIYKCLFDRINNKILGPQTLNIIYKKINSYGTGTLTRLADPKKMTKKQLRKYPNYKDQLGADGLFYIDSNEVFEIRMSGEKVIIDLPDPSIVSEIEESRIQNKESLRTLRLLAKKIDEKQRY